MKELIVFLDSGDTLVDESTEIRDNAGTVIYAELFAGAETALRILKASGYRIALVADGLEASFRNIYKQHGLEDCFEVNVISELVGTEKPDCAMFTCAMEKMGLTEKDKRRIIMIGNNLERDVVGANRMGIGSVLASYSPRYRMQPQTQEEVPDYVVSLPAEIPGLVDLLNTQLENRKILKLCE